MNNIQAAPSRVRPPREGQSKGQWAVDGKTPLNHNEEFKAEENPLAVRQRIIDVYSQQGIDSVPEDDLHGRFRWLGIYTQRKPGIDARSTSKLDAGQLSDKYFMMRIRIDGQQLNLDQVRVLGSIGTDFARDTADISDRQNVQYHWIAIEDVPEIWRRLESVGLSTTEACGDTPRGFLMSPVAGISADEIIDPTPTARAISERWIGDEQFANLPRKFKTAITGHPSLDVVHEINDISFVGVEHPEFGPGYDLWVGGALSTTPRLAERLGVFVRAEEAVEVWAGVCGIFRDYGYRKLRTKARLKFLLAEWGPEKFRQVLQEEYLGRELPDGPAPAKAVGSADHVGVGDQKDGRKYVGFAPTVGRLSGTILTGVAALAEAAGSGRISFTPHQKLLVLDVDPGKVEELVAGMEELGLTAKPSPFRRATMACTGIEYCKLAFVETKGLAARTITDLEQRLDDVELPRPISLNINGCPNSCARIQIADIGLKGQLAGDDFAFQVHLGGGLASQERDEAGLGRTVRGLKITADDLPDYVERVTRSYLDGHHGDETFAEWAHRADEEALR
ncbi:nitrite/sulfite reductase [Luteococcus japonicus]|uniref:assimilatory sulfite reductase (ferredoxin) n=1 Tax=Luteococcus japonicus LSP_Lj1 TaxID=1255658 RepID=A0A1R4IZP1_9ACTN|nr:nitrite/sulfite reductase [Luteococcus japonicus]SJN25005.1 Ferredoxin--sulfite reductase, actinobacterial type [Luteococcus japonicus LSP_Lj1]